MKKDIQTIISIDFVGVSDVSKVLPLPSVFTRICRLLTTSDVEEAFRYAVSLVEFHRDHYEQICPNFKALISVSKLSPYINKFRPALTKVPYLCLSKDSSLK